MADRALLAGYPRNMNSQSLRWLPATAGWLHMGVKASQFWRLIWTNNKKYIGSSLLTICEGNPLLTSGFQSQRTSDAEHLSKSWLHTSWQYMQSRPSLYTLTDAAAQPLITHSYCYFKQDNEKTFTNRFYCLMTLHEHILYVYVPIVSSCLYASSVHSYHFIACCAFYCVIGQ